MLELLLAIEYAVLHFFNVELASPAMDRFWLFITHVERYPAFMLIVLPLLIGWLFYIYRATAFKILIVAALTVGLTDAINYRIVKHLVERPRPFQNLAIAGWVRHVGDAHGSSFPSNHAANCFAGAMILAYYIERRRWIFYVFALLVAISRVSLGVHYPSDVIAGAMLGSFVGLWS